MQTSRLPATRVRLGHNPALKESGVEGMPKVSLHTGQDSAGAKKGVEYPKNPIPSSFVHPANDSDATEPVQAICPR